MKKKKKLKKSIKYFIIITLAIITGLVTYNVFNSQINDLFKKPTNNETEKPDVEKPIIKPDPIPVETYPKITSLNMITAGDALIHGAVYKSAAKNDGTYDFCKFLTQIEPIVKNYDLAFYNQESIIGGKNLGLSSYPRFNSPDEIGDCMVSLGFNVVSLANNHTLDKNETGVLYSVNYWKNKDVLHAGQYSSFEDRDEIRIKEKNGIKYTMLSYTTVTNGLLPPKGKEYLTNIYSNEKATQDIESLKDKVDLIIVAMHWGVEYTNVPSQDQKNIANHLASLGVNVIIGHHPHVLQPIEYIDDTLVIYSLGNFISAQATDDRLTGALVSYDVVKTTYEDKTFDIEIKNPKADLIYTKRPGGGYSGYNVIPYSNLNSNIFSKYQSYYEKYKNILNKYTAVEVTGIN